MKVHLLWTSEWGRPTNTEHHFSQLRQIDSTLNKWQITRARSNADALQSLLASNKEDGNISIAPFYNVHGKWVRDTMKTIAENHTSLKLLHISRLSVDYILAHLKWTNLADTNYVASHDQAILQTRGWWSGHGLPRNLKKIWDNNTAAWLDLLTGGDERSAHTLAISTPWQWRESDGWILDRVDNFGPPNNHTYFGIFWLRWVELWEDIFHQQEVENPEGIEFWVIELDDSPGSLANALLSIADEGKNIHSIMSFPQSSGKVLFVIAYDEQTTLDTSPTNKISWSITEVHSNSEVIPYKYRLSIPNSRWSLGRVLKSISHLIDIRSIESIGTSRENTDFEIKITEKSSSSKDILAHLESIISQINFYSTPPKVEKWNHTLYTLTS